MSNNALVIPDVILSQGVVEVSRTGLVIRADLSQDEWVQIGAKLAEAEGGVHWWIGDWLNYGERRWGETYQVAVERTGFSYSTVAHDAYVASAIDVCRRRQTLSWGHHYEVAALEPEQQDYWLDQAEQGNWTREQLRRARRLARSAFRSALATSGAVIGQGVQVIQGNMLLVLPTLTEKFDLVIADPPYNVTEWDWDKRGELAKFLQETRDWLIAIQGVVKPEYHLFWFCSPKFAADIELIFRELALPIRSRIVWHRRNMAEGSDAVYAFIDSWDMIFHVGTRPLNYPPAWDDGRFDVQVFAVPQTNYTDRKLHPTQKPEALITWLVNYGSYPGDNVLDPFAGSGTTGAACQGVERDCTLIEAEEEYVTVIRQRLGL